MHKRCRQKIHLGKNQIPKNRNCSGIVFCDDQEKKMALHIDNTINEASMTICRYRKVYGKEMGIQKWVYGYMQA